ncbi:MAG TPA: alpha/beta fold hydrolase [Elusimicrobiota bacterium]|jgi:pimeloyl-ACP methyl ester carboxylesterase|nr:alpha/beta fold hydrolase [Elusimicrobiota bacterium]
MVQARRNTAFLTALAWAWAGLGAPRRAVAAGPAAPTASAPEVSVRIPTLPGLPEQFTTSDGWTLSAQFHPAKPGFLTLMLIPGVGQDKNVWSDLARVLARAGYGVLAVDLRGQGGSTLGPGGKTMSWRQFSSDRDGNDFMDMGRDVDAAAVFLSSAGVAPSSIGLIGNGLGASLAARYAAIHPEIPLVALLSPTLNGENVPIISALRAYGSRPILIAYSMSDRGVANAAPLIFAVAKLSAGAADATLITTRLPADFLFDRSVSERILDWLETPASPATAVSASSGAATGQIDVSSPAAASPPAPSL